MNKQEAMAVLAQYLPPPILSEFMQFWWASGLEQQASKSDPAENGEPLFDDYCPHCAAHGIKAAHMLGTTEHCPHNPARFGWMQKRETR